MGLKRPNSTAMSGKTLTDNVTQGDRGRGQTGQAGGHLAVFTQQSGRQVPPTDQGPTRTPGNSRAPSTGSPSPTSPMVPPGDNSDEDHDSNPGDLAASNQRGTAAQGSGQKTNANTAGETMGPSSRPSASQNTKVGSPNLTGNGLLTPSLAQAHQDAMRSARM